MTHPTPFPGPRKAGDLPLLRPFSRRGWLVSDYRVRQLFEAADVMSEGAWRSNSDRGEPSYFGTTSVVLWVRSAGGMIPDPDLLQAAAIFRHDPHVRLRALRIAVREASVRAGGGLGPVRAELAVSCAERCVRIHVDVEASAALPLPHRRRVVR